MTSIFICDDNCFFLKNLTDIITLAIDRFGYDMMIARSAEKPQDILKGNDIDHSNSIYFLDIDLKAAMNGLDLAQRIRARDPRGYIVFVTTHAEMSPLTFRYKTEAFDFLVKDKGNVESLVSNCLAGIHGRICAVSENEQYFKTQVAGKVIMENTKNIILFELSATTRKVLLVTAHRQVEFYATLKEVEEKLGDNFIRCSKTTIVNKDMVRSVDRSRHRLLLENDEECEVSVRGMTRVLEALEQSGK